MKLKVPRFDGTKPLGWIFKINQFFEYHGTPENERLTIASFYMEGKALAWFQWMTGNGQFTLWPVFLQALQTRFAPSQYEDPTRALFKLTQKGSEAQYLLDFEDLANRIVGLPPAFLLSCFVSGLTSEIRREVQAHQPLMLVQAASLACLQEEKLLDVHHPPWSRVLLVTIVPPYTPSPSPRTVTLPPPLPPPGRPAPPPLKCLSLKEIASRREGDLYFNYDEKFHRGHHCASRVFLLIAEEDENPDPHIVLNDPPPDPPGQVDSLDLCPTQISFHSLAGQLAPKTLRMLGSLFGHQVMVLVDSGSTHNFIQQELVTHLNLPCRMTSVPLWVMVGNGQHLQCTSLCEEIVIDVQSSKFTVDLHILPIFDANVVLGIQWLKSLGPVLTNYNMLCMQFIHDDRVVELKGDTDDTLNIIIPSQFRRLARSQAPGLYCHISLLSEATTIPQDLHPAIQSILTKFEHLFQQPNCLPPEHDTDHHIHLLPQIAPINVWPYHYSHFQKCEIEAQVDLMLQKGLIQPSTSPFSSLVLLVKKNDGSWQFCVDYRTLNTITIRDCFPIPTIDELLDELGGARCFSKLDLLQGYHQIRMHSEDMSKTTFCTHNGHYKFRVMPFGLCNAPSSFQATMNNIFRPYLHHFIIVFFDDILIYSTCFDDHLHHLELTFQVLSDNQFVLKMTKCFFAQNQVEYLGHLVSHRGVEPVASKVNAIH